MVNAGRAAAFLDRDGTIIEDRDYLADPDEVRLLPGAAGAIARLNAAGVPVLVITNQSGIGRGYFGEAEYRAVADRIDAILEHQGGRIDATYYCPHAPDEPVPCDCRKPSTGLFERAARDFDVDPSQSWFVGDRLRDVSPGVRLGGIAYLIERPDSGSDEGVPQGIRIVRSLAEAVTHMLETGRFD